MKLLGTWIQFLALISVCLALAVQGDGDDKTTSTSVTIAWVTVTTNGGVATVKTTFKQSFMDTYTSAVKSVAAGSIGMGAQSGTVGGVRTYSQTTISNAGDVVSSSSLGVAFLLLNFLF